MALIVLAGGIIFTFLIAILQVLLDYRQERDALDARLGQVRMIEVPSLANSVWHFDSRQIETQLQGMLNLQDIRSIELQVEGGETYRVGQTIPAADAITQTEVLEYTQDGETYTLGVLQVTADSHSLRQRVLRRFFTILAVSALQILALAGLFLLITQLILTRALNDIASYADRLDLTTLDAPLVMNRRRLAPRGDELEHLAAKLNEMRLRLSAESSERAQAQEALQVSERNYREIFNATSEAIFIHDVLNAAILQVNIPMLRLFGYTSKNEVLGRPISDLSANKPPHTQDEALQWMRKAIAGGPQIFEWQSKKKTGDLFWSEVSLRVTSIGGDQCILAVVRDISERKKTETLLLAQNQALVSQRQALEAAEAKARQLNIELENRVKERTLQLTAVNEELESFSYSVAHDLRSPLRRITGFSQIIQEDHAAELSGEVKGWLERINESTYNLSEMIDGLLALSRASRNETEFVDLDLSAIAQEIAAGLRLREPGRAVEFNIAPALTARADRKLIRIAMENLLENAWKYSSGSEPACIEIGGVTAASTTHPVFFVRDNGAGFDMAYADRLFTPFQRLHTASEFAGTGIGLATVKRVISRHGGNIWAESKPGAGATFFFTLPGPG
jgi:PAS domain S-box-containing protein